MIPSRVRVASWPHWYGPNPYLPAFYEALEAHGIEHVPDLPLQAADLVRANIDLLHLHWPYPAWRDAHPVRQPDHVLRFLRRLRRIRKRDIRLAWTVHNLEPHENPNRLDRIGYRGVHRQSALCIHHSRWSEQEAERLYGKPGGDSLVMPHGSYHGFLPNPARISETRRGLGLAPAARLLVCLGQIRPFKGHDVAVRAMDALPESHWHLLVAGRSIGDTSGLAELAQSRRNVTLMLGDLSDQRFVDLMAAADVVLVPYVRTTGSGVLMAALTMGQAVVASDLPYFREMAEPDPSALELATPGDPRALAAAVKRCLDQDVEERRAAAKRLAERYRWPEVVRPVALWIRDRL